MSFSIVIIAAAGLALANTAGVLTRAIEARYSVEIPAVLEMSNPCCGTVRATPGVAAADAVPESEMRRTLERWLGPGGAERDLPVPAMVNFDVEAGRRSWCDQQRVTRPRPARGSRRIAKVGPLLRSLACCSGWRSAWSCC